MDTEHNRNPAFAPTRWSVVLAAGQEDSVHARAALATLCQAYWYPLYSYVRRQGHSPADAQDLTQEFFARLVAKRYLARVQRAGGRFRSFLLTAIQRFLANEWDRAHAQKRGGFAAVVSIDAADAESRYRLEPAHELTAEKIFEQRWAEALLARVLARLRAEYASAGKEALLDALSASLSQPRGAVPYAAIATRLNTTEAAVRMAAHRLRARYREVLRAEIADTVASPAEVEEEIRYLFATFGG